MKWENTNPVSANCKCSGKNIMDIVDTSSICNIHNVFLNIYHHISNSFVILYSR